jgi:transcriptional regulator with XRE-family HTH domain
MITELGQMIKILRIRAKNISQHALAKDLDYSPSYFSSIMNGKIDPDMKFIAKCLGYFNLDHGETIEFITKALSSCKTISIDVSYLAGKRPEWLIKVIVSLLLIPEPTSFNSVINNVEKSIDIILESLNSYQELRKLEAS